MATNLAVTLPDDAVERLCAIVLDHYALADDETRATIEEVMVDERGRFVLRGCQVERDEIFFPMFRLRVPLRDLGIERGIFGLIQDQCEMVS